MKIAYFFCIGFFIVLFSAIPLVAFLGALVSAVEYIAKKLKNEPRELILNILLLALFALACTGMGFFASKI